MAGAIGTMLATACTASAQLPLHIDGFRLSSAQYVAHESSGAAVITVLRSDASQAAWIGVVAFPGTADAGTDFIPEKSIVKFAPGQTSTEFQVPIVDHHLPGTSRSVHIGLFDGYPIGISNPRSALLTIINDDKISFARNPLNPLALATPPPASDILQGALAYVDWKRDPAAELARRWRDSQPQAATMLQVIAEQPSVARYGTWDGRQVGLHVSQYLEQAAHLEPSAVPELSTYDLSSHGCSHSSDPPGRVGAYHEFIQSLANGIGGYRAIIFLEEDAVMTFGCLSHKGRVERVHELRYAINVLSRLPHLVIYVDGGAADALSASRTARILRDVGVSKIQGFFLNSTHFDWTSREIRYGEAISGMTGGKHFVVNTSENGQGPLKPPNPVRQGNEILCNPPGRGLGPKPTFDTGYPNVDAFAWIAYPGQSDGACRPGAPKVGAFWAAWALELVQRADFSVR